MKKQFVLGILGLLSTFCSTSITAKDFSEMGRDQLESYTRELEQKVNAVESTLTDSLEVLLDERSNDWAKILKKSMGYTYFGYTKDWSDEQITTLIEKKSGHIKELFERIDSNPDAVTAFLSYYYERQFEGALQNYPHNQRMGTPIEGRFIRLLRENASKNNVTFKEDYTKKFTKMKEMITDIGIDEYIKFTQRSKQQKMLTPPPPPPPPSMTLSTGRLGRGIKPDQQKKIVTKINGQVVKATFSQDTLQAFLKRVSEREERVANGQQNFVQHVGTQIFQTTRHPLSETTSSNSIEYHTLFTNTTSTTAVKSESPIGSDSGQNFITEQDQDILYDSDDQQGAILNQFIAAARKNGFATDSDQDNNQDWESDSEI